MHPTINFISFIACLAFVLSAPKASCQDSEGQSPRLKIVSAYVLPGAISVTIPANTLTDFRTLAPESKIQNQDFVGYDDTEDWNSSSLFHFAPAIGIRFNRPDGNASNHFLMRVGIDYSEGELLHAGRYKSTRVPYDTLISTQTGEATYLDSVFSNSVSMIHSASFLQLDVSFLWSTDFNARFQVYGGVGLAAGLSFNAATSIREYDNAYGAGGGYDYYDKASKSERFLSQSSFSGNVYLPLGLDWQLGKQGFWEAIHLVCEFRPALAVYTIPELDSYISPSFGFLSGMKVGW